ncbi:MAG TPA: alpha/beta fold hydrolase [Stellaceae bacterium]|nr:alpha/beta fold hydrolase [Stellaceae bacterium]
MTDPAAAVAALEARAKVVRTPCGSGSMLWHIWGRGAPLVLLHGGYGSWTHWFRNVEPLAERYRLLVADLPGLGDSDMPPEPYSAASIAEIVSAGLASLLGAGEEFDLAGFSFGGLIGGHIAASVGARMRRLVLVGSGGLGVPRRATIELVNWRERPDPAAQRAAHRENLALLMFADPRNIDELAIYLQTRNAERARTRSRPLSRAATLLTALPYAKARLHGIWGEGDITARGALDEHRRLLRSFQQGASLAAIPGAGHWVQYEAPESFLTALLAILRD